MILKTISLFLFSFISTFSTNNSVYWNKLVHDFGDVNQGEILKTSFTCYNKSDTTLVFENVQSSCGCMVPNWTRKPIPANDSTTIEVQFDTKGNTKRHNKTIAVYTNQGLFELNVKVNILK